MPSLSNDVYKRAYVGMGSNLGDRIKQLIDAKNQLRALTNTVTLRSSSLYETSPVGYSEQDKFINCVIELEFSANQDVLFSAMQLIERNIGRVRDSKNQNAPRSIDLDLLSFGSIQTDDPKLTIPHPRIKQRLFVLIPLLELQPKLQIPSLGSVGDVLEDGNLNNYFAAQSIRKLGANEVVDWVSS